MLDGEPAGSAVVEQDGTFTILVNGPGEEVTFTIGSLHARGETPLDTGGSDRAGPERQRIDAKPLPVGEPAQGRKARRVPKGRPGAAGPLGV